MLITNLNTSCFANHIKVGLLGVDQLQDEFQMWRKRLFETKLSNYRVDKILQFKFEKDQLLSFAAGVLLDEMLSKNYSLRESQMRYIEGQNGKPTFANHPEIHFNLSHSGSFTVCAIGDQEMGIDIEQTVQVNDMEDIANHFFTPCEQAQLKAYPTIDNFYRIWTRKESLLKTTGQGLCADLDSAENIAKNYTFTEFNIPNYKITLCSKKLY